MALPQPVSVTDEYLAEIHGLLGEIRDRLPAPKPEAKPGPTKVAEPANRPAKKTTTPKS